MLTSEGFQKRAKAVSVFTHDLSPVRILLSDVLFISSERSDEIGLEDQKLLRAYVQRGGTLVVVLAHNRRAKSNALLSAFGPLVTVPESKTLLNVAEAEFDLKQNANNPLFAGQDGKLAIGHSIPRITVTSPAMVQAGMQTGGGASSWMPWWGQPVTNYPLVVKIPRGTIGAGQVFVINLGESAMDDQNLPFLCNIVRSAVELVSISLHFTRSLLLGARFASGHWFRRAILSSVCACLCFRMLPLQSGQCHAILMPSFLHLVTTRSHCSKMLMALIQIKLTSLLMSVCLKPSN